MASENVETLVKEFDAAYAVLADARRRKTELATLAGELPTDSPLRRLLENEAPALLAQGQAALLHLASARPARDLLRQALESWLGNLDGNAGIDWLRYLEGPAVSLRSEAIHTIVAHKQRAFGIAVLPDGSAWTWGKDGRELRRWNLETGEQLAKASSTFEVTRGAVSATGLLAAGSAHDESTVAVWGADGKRLYRFENTDNAFFASVTWLASSQGEALLVADGNLKVIELGKKRRTRWTIPVQASPTVKVVDQIAVLPDGEHAVYLEISDTQPARVRAHVIRLADGSIARSVAIADELSACDEATLVLSPNGKLLAFAVTSSPGAEGAFVWDLDTGRTRLHAAGDRRVLSLCFDGDDRIWCGTADGCIVQGNLESGKVSALRTATDSVQGVAVWKDFVVAACNNGRVLRFTKSECRYELDELIRSARVARLLPVAGQPRVLMTEQAVVFDVSEGQAPRQLAKLPAGYDAVAVSARGLSFVSATPLADGKVRLDWFRVPEGGEAVIVEHATFDVEGTVEQLVVTEGVALLHMSAKYRCCAPLLIITFDGSKPHSPQALGEHLIRDFCACPESKQIACALQTANGKLLLLDHDGTLQNTLTLDGSDIVKLGVLGDMLLAVSQSGTVGIFSLPSGEPRPTQLKIKSGTPPFYIRRTIVGSLETDRAIVASGYGPPLLLRPSDGAAISTLGSSVNDGARFSLEGRLVAAIDVQGVVTIWRADDGKLLVTQAFATPATDVVWLGSRELLVRDKARALIRLSFNSS